MSGKLAVFICYDKDIKDKNIISAITYGIEEEGIPYQLKELDYNNFNKLAVEASNESQLDVGIGVDAKENICLHHSKLPNNFFLFGDKHNKDIKKLRNIGVNGARLVKGIPFKI